MIMNALVYREACCDILQKVELFSILMQRINDFLGKVCYSSAGLITKPRGFVIINGKRALITCSSWIHI
jgi:hypothetical protein